MKDPIRDDHCQYGFLFFYRGKHFHFNTVAWKINTITSVYTISVHDNKNELNSIPCRGALDTIICEAYVICRSLIVCFCIAVGDPLSNGECLGSH